MKKFYNILISNFLARYIFLLTFIISIVTLFGNININEYPKPVFFIKVFLVFITPLFLNIIFEIFTNKLITNIEDTSDILSIINHRIGSQISTRTLDEKEYDNIHKFTLIYRQDQLKYDNLNYFSFRILKGINISKSVSSYIVYTESTDIPISFKDIKINARNNINGKTLVVECLHSITEKRLQHTFKINFDQPIPQNETFDISYSIEILNEMTIYDQTKEIQSISLVRIKQPISKLIFNVCLDFEPRAVKVYARKITGGLIEIDKATIKKYTPNSEIQNIYNIEWGNSVPYIIETDIVKPRNDQYIIEFIR
ncbi:MAG: hypothetical protein HDR19_06470 [Lachnospiraceae bacterium]|nr:hypothetical protein [Lachnospiraceae bacterium]